MLKFLKALALLTLSDPRAAVLLLLQNRPAQAVLLQGAALVVVLGVMASWGFAHIIPEPPSPVIDALMGNPILFAVVQYAMLMISVILIFLVGRFFKGHGSFEQSLLVSIWLQFYMLLWQIFLFFVGLLVPMAAAVLNMAIIFYLLWLMVNFIAALHGFSSLWKVLAGIIATSFLVSFLVVFLLALTGIGFKGA